MTATEVQLLKSLISRLDNFVNRIANKIDHMERMEIDNLILAFDMFISNQGEFHE